MASTAAATAPPPVPLTYPASNVTHCNRSPDLSDTLSRHMFITTVIPRPLLAATKLPAAEGATGAVVVPGAVPPTPPIRDVDQRRVRKSLDELGHDIRELQDFLSVTEEVLQRERERDREFYARERRRKLHHDQHRSSQHNNNKENTPITCPIYSLQSPTYKRPAHPALRKCKSASPAPAAPSTQAATTADDCVRRRRRLQHSSSALLVTTRRQSTMDALQLMVRMQHDLDEPSSSDGASTLLGGGNCDGYIAESEFDPDCLRHSDTEDGLDRASTNLMVSSSTEEEDDDDGNEDELHSSGGDDSLEMVVVVKGDGEGQPSCDQKRPPTDLSMREGSAQSNAT